MCTTYVYPSIVNVDPRGDEAAVRAKLDENNFEDGNFSLLATRNEHYRLDDFSQLPFLP